MSNTDKDSIIKILGGAKVYYPEFCKALGDVCAGVFVSRIFYWSDKGKDPEGWIYKTQEEIEEETGLTRRNQESARRKARELGLLEEKRAGLPAKLYFKLDYNKLFNLVEQGTRYQWRDVERSMAALDARGASMSESDNQGCTSMSESDILGCSLSELDTPDCPIPTSCSVEDGQTVVSNSDKHLYTYVTTYVTAIDTAKGGDPNAITGTQNGKAEDSPPPLIEPVVVASTATGQSLYFGLPDPRGVDPRSKAIGEYLQVAQRFQIGPEQFRLMVNAVLDGMGKLALAEVDDAALNEGQEVTKCLILLGAPYRTVEGIETIFSTWRQNNEFGGSAPSANQVKSYASQMMAGKTKQKGAAQNGAAKVSFRIAPTSHRSPLIPTPADSPF